MMERRCRKHSGRAAAGRLVGLAAAAVLAGGFVLEAARPAAAATLLRISTEDRVARLKVVAGRSETFRLTVPFGEIVVGDPETADVNALSDRTL